MLRKNVPEGNILFPLDPSIVQQSGNLVTLETEHFNPAHYLATSEYSIIGNMGYVEEFVFAESQQGADDYLAAKDTYNHSHPDIGVYAKTNTRVPIRPGNGEVVTIDLDLWNLGQAACSNSVIDVFGGPTNLSENSFHDRFILSQKRSDAINPMEKQNVKLSFTKEVFPTR